MRSPSPQHLLALGISSILLALTACGDSGSAEPAPSTPASASASAASPSASAKASTKASVAPASTLKGVTVTGAYGKAPKVTVKEPWAIDKTRSTVLKKSSGPAIKKTDTVEVNYYGVNARTGKKFDDSYSRGEPAVFSLGQVVPGFQKGLLGQRQGSRVLIAMPGKDGYDQNGGSPEIGIEVGDTLIFVVDVLAVPLAEPAGDKVAPKKGLPTVTDTAEVPKVSIPTTEPPKTLQVQPLIKGRGKKVSADDTITFDYTWVRWSDGKVLEESYSGQPANHPLSGLLPGMAKGLAGQTVGSRVLLVIPPAEGYPQGNATPKVEKTDTLVMVVDLLFTASGQ